MLPTMSELEILYIPRAYNFHWLREMFTNADDEYDYSSGNPSGCQLMHPKMEVCGLVQAVQTRSIPAISIQFRLHS